MFKWLKEVFFGEIQKPKIIEEKRDPSVSIDNHVTHWSKKTMTPQKPFGKRVSKKAKSHTKAQLSKMTKKDLEALGRKQGIELVSRLVKSKLVDQLHKAL